MWQIPFKNHYHPTVAKYAEFLFKGEKIKDEPDMQNHTLIHFLDRFVYRNPKKNVKPRGGSMMQPLLARRDGGVTMTRNSNVDEVPVVSEEFWRKKIEDVPVDEVFQFLIAVHYMELNGSLLDILPQILYTKTLW